MKSITSNNSINNIKDKYSKKRINNISNRIRSLEKDINKIRNRETLISRKSIDDNMSIILDKNSNTMITNESKLKPKNKYTINQKSFVKNYLLYNDNKENIKSNSNNTSYIRKPYKAKIKRESPKSQIYKKITKYNNLIHDKKNSILNMKPHFHKRTNTKDNYKEFSKISLSKNFDINKNTIYKIDYTSKENDLYNNRIKSNFNNNERNHHYMSVDKLNTNYENNESNEMLKNFKDSSIHINEMNNMGNLEYEFEIRHLKKKRNLLKQKNIEMISKLDKIKNNNIKIENSIIEEQKKNQNIVNNIILFNKNYLAHNNPNGLESIESSSITSSNNDLSFKNIILNIMDIKFDYENNLLFNKFIEGINELLNIPLLNNNNFNDNILKKIREAINIEKSLEKSNDKYRQIFLENNKYLIHFKNLINELNLKNFEEFYLFVQNLFVKNIKEKERMKQIKKALIKDTTPDNKKLMKEKENIKKKISNQYSLSVNQTIFNNINNNDKNSYKVKKSYINKDNNRIKQIKINNYIYSKRKDNNSINSPQILLNRTGKDYKFDNPMNNTLNINKIHHKRKLDDDIFSNEYKTFVYENEKNNKYTPLNYEKKKFYNMNIPENNKNNDKINSLIRQNYFNGINNIYNRYLKKNNYNQNDDDILFLKECEEEKINDNIFNVKPLAQTKNHSAFNIMYNK